MAQEQANKIKIVNPPLDGEPRTYLTQDCDAGATVIYTLDNAGFTLSGVDDYYILIGDYGSERSEIVLVDASDGSTGNNSFKISATKYSHEASDPVTFIRYNKIKIYGSVDSGGTKVLITTIDIDSSQQFTEYTYVGDTYSYFYTTYYNSNGDIESDYSDEISATSFTRRSAKRIIEAALRKAMTEIDEGPNSKLTWDVALEILQDGIDEILTQKRDWPFLRKIYSGTQTTANTEYIDKPSDLNLLMFLKVNNRTLDVLSQLDYNNYTSAGATVVAKGSPTHYVEKNNKYYLYPTPDGTYDIVYEYYKVPATITSDLSTEIDLPFVPLLIYYCAAHFAWIRGNDKRGDKMYKLFEDKLQSQIEEYSGPDQTGFAEYVERTSPYDEVTSITSTFSG